MPGFTLLAEVGRGGMGVVYRARDAALHRDVAVKVLQDRYPAEGEAARRFVEEAQLTAQLQHPGIPPIHHVGALANGRPFLAMKLIKGDTLDKLLRQRTSPDQERGRFLAVFEQICQAVGYAHAHEVLHRDIKPSNVMVGAFGEVQVMDWGLSKSIRDAQSTQSKAAADAPPRTEIASLRDAGSGTRTGSVMGTPAFMPPEQAGGEVAKIDARSDVFSLGAVLCVVLTGQPPYAGETAEAVHSMAIRAELAGALARLDACGAEPELVALCKKCLAVERDGRPRDANELADAVAAFRSAAEERARQAELDRVRAEGERAVAEARAEEELNTSREAEARAAEQRKKRRVQLALAAAVGLLLAAGGGVAWHLDRQAGEQKLKDERAESERTTAEAKMKGEADAERRFKAEQARQGAKASLSLAVDLRKQYKFKEADAALAQAATMAKGGAPELLREVEQARGDLAFVVKLDDIRYRKWRWISAPGDRGDFNLEIAAPAYRRAFAERGLDMEHPATDEAAERIAASAVRAEVVAAVDDWALHAPSDTLRDRLLEIARKADQGQWTDRLRTPAVWKDKSALAGLAADANPATASPASLVVLAELMERNGLNPAPLLTRARAEYPSNFELAFNLGRWYGRTSKDGRQIGAYEAARALRPDNQTVWNNLGNALLNRRDLDGAVVAYRKATDLDPKDARAYNNLGIALKDKGDLDGAIAAYEKAIEIDSKDGGAYNNLGIALHDKHDLDGAIVAHKKAIDLQPNDARFHYNLGSVWLDKDKYPEAVACARAAVRADPKYADAHMMLGFALRQTGDISGARAALTDAARLDKRWAGMLARLPPVPTAPPPHEAKR